MGVWVCGRVGVWVYEHAKILHFWSPGGSFLTSFGVPGAPGERPEHHVEEVAEINRISIKKWLPKGSVFRDNCRLTGITSSIDFRFVFFYHS